MGYKPTLGGLKKAQEFLKLKGHLLPVFQMNIYDDGQLMGSCWMPGKGRTIPIDEAIRTYGVMCEVVDVQLSSEQGDAFVRFSSTLHASLFTGIEGVERGWDVVPEFHKDSPVDCGDFKNFRDSADGKAFMNLARWGKSAVSWLDRLEFSLFPESYGREIFHEYRAG